MIKLYGSGAARSRRVQWALEEVGQPYEFVELAWPPRLRHPEYLAISPSGTVPAIVDGEVRLTESLAICEYLGRTYGGGLVVEPDEAGFLDYLEFSHFGEGTLMPPLAWMRRFGRQSAEARAECEEAFVARLRALDRVLADGRAFLAADRLTCADISVGFVLSLSATYDFDQLLSQAVADYLTRLCARPAFQRAYGLG